MSKDAFVTFDLTKDNKDYKKAYEILGGLGLSQLVPEDAVFLPNTSVLGQVPDGWSSESLRDLIVEKFEAAGLNLSALFCTVGFDEYAGVGERAEQRLAAIMRFRR